MIKVTINNRYTSILMSACRTLFGLIIMACSSQMAFADVLMLKDPITINLTTGKCEIIPANATSKRRATWGDIVRHTSLKDSAFEMDKIVLDESSGNLVFSAKQVGLYRNAGVIVGLPGAAAWMQGFFLAKVALSNKQGLAKARAEVQKKNPKIDIKEVDLTLKVKRCSTKKDFLYTAASYIRHAPGVFKETIKKTFAIQATKELVQHYTWGTSNTTSNTVSYGGSASVGFSFKGISGGAEAHYENSTTHTTSTSAEYQKGTSDTNQVSRSVERTIELTKDQFYGAAPKIKEVTKKVWYVEVELEESLDGWVVYDCPKKLCAGHYYMANTIDSFIGYSNKYFEAVSKGRGPASLVTENKIVHTINGMAPNNETGGQIAQKTFKSEDEFQKYINEIKNIHQNLKLTQIDLTSLGSQ